MIAVEAELVAGALEATSTQLGLSPVFMGVVVLALVGTAADLFAALVFARQDKMDIVFSMCVGSAIQIALVVAPVLVLAGLRHFTVGSSGEVPRNFAVRKARSFCSASAAVGSLYSSQ